MKSAQSSISKALSDGNRVGIVRSLTRKVTFAESDALAIHQVNSGNNIHGYREL